MIISTAKNLIHYSKVNKFGTGEGMEIKEERCTLPRFYYKKNDEDDY